MKNPKKIIGAVTALMLLFSMYSFGYTTSTPSGSDKIILTGNAHNPGSPRVPAAPSINAYLTGDFITINYLSDLGNVHIEVKDESESKVYQCTEPSGANNTSYIDLYYFESGLYTITITNDGSLYLQGVFEL